MPKALNIALAGMILLAACSPEPADADQSVEVQRADGAAAQLIFVSGAVEDDVIEVAQITEFEGDVAPSHVRLWGLDVQDEETFRTLLSNRLIRCDLLSLRDGEALGVCRIGLRLFDERSWSGIRFHPEESIFLLNWLPEFGVARRQCTPRNTHGRPEYIIGDGAYFGCIEDGSSNTSVEIDEGTFVPGEVF